MLQKMQDLLQETFCRSEILIHSNNRKQGQNTGFMAVWRWVLTSGAVAGSYSCLESLAQQNESRANSKRGSQDEVRCLLSVLNHIKESRQIHHD